jgi:hypothetical protein
MISLIKENPPPVAMGLNPYGAREGLYSRLKSRLVVAFLARFCARRWFLRRIFEELNQPVNQSSTATNNMQSALVLMFF